MDAAAPGITSPFQVGTRRKGRCQIHLFQLLKENKGFPKAKEDFAYVYLARTLSKVTYSCRRWMVFVLPGSRVETAKGRGVGSGCGASCSKRTGCSWTPVAPASRRCWGFFFPFEGSWSIWDPIPAATRQTPGSRAFVSIGCSPCPLLLGVRVGFPILQPPLKEKEEMVGVCLHFQVMKHLGLLFLRSKIPVMLTQRGSSQSNCLGW